MQRSLGPQELVDLPINRALAPPLYDRVEQEPVKSEHVNTFVTAEDPSAHHKQNSLIAPIRILLPSINLVIHTERYTFFEASLGVSGPPVFSEKFVRVER
jgi:hypothetical protein